MTAIPAPASIPLALDTAAQRLRRVSAAVRVSFTWMGVRRTLTREQKDEAAQPFAAEGQFLSAGKKLIDTRHEAFRKLTGVRGRVISYWRGISLPYVEPGIRLIRQSDVATFDHMLAGFRAELLEAEGGLNAVYDQVRADARRRLGRLFNAADYPSEIRDLFRVDWDFPSIEPPNYLLRLSPEIYHQEQQRVVARFEEAVRLAEQAFISELGKLVTHLSERLTDSNGEKKVFRDSAVANLREFFERFRTLNVRSNPELEALVERAQQTLRGVQPGELRDNAALRQQVVAQLGAVQTRLDGLLVDAPRRRIVRGGATNGNGQH